MASNVEVKARCADCGSVRANALALGAREEGTFEQEDTFFRCAEGRLKLRILDGLHGELIAYARADSSGPRPSDYTVAPVESPLPVQEALSRSLGCLGVVRKRRTLLMLGATRIHLDRVEGLGSFVELERVLEPGEAPAAAQEEVAALMRRLGIEEQDLVAVAYRDLLPQG